jgi:exodeoxyribonuclease-5
VGREQLAHDPRQSYCARGSGAHPNARQPRRWASFGLGYAITTDKAQGSEWPRVLIIDDFAGADRARWLYTAITRASEAVSIVDAR